MTTFAMYDCACACCGEAVSVPRVTTTNAFGSMDLDMRPPPMQRDTQALEMLECPKCGYCSHDIGQAFNVERTKVMVASAGYRMLVDGALPNLPSRFVRWALVTEAAGRFDLAGDALKEGAWAADDLGDDVLATELRLRAVAKLDVFRDGGGLSDGADEWVDALKIDMLRRAGWWEAAEVVGRARLAGEVSDMARQVFGFQLTLIAQHDSACHKVSEVLTDEEPAAEPELDDSFDIPADDGDIGQTAETNAPSPRDPESIAVELLNSPNPAWTMSQFFGCEGTVFAAIRTAEVLKKLFADISDENGPPDLLERIRTCIGVVYQVSEGVERNRIKLVGELMEYSQAAGRAARATLGGEATDEQVEAAVNHHYPSGMAQGAVTALMTMGFITGFHGPATQ